MWGFVCVLFSLRSHPVTCISVTRWNLSHILGSKQSFTAKKTEAFKGVFPASFFSGSCVCAAFGQISGHHCFDCCVLPRVSIFRMRTPPVLFLIQAVTSPANCKLPNAFNRKVAKPVAAHPLCSWLPTRSYFRPDLCGFFFSPEFRGGMIRCSSLQDDDDVSLFRVSCEFYSTQKQTHLQPRCCFHVCVLIWVFQPRTGQFSITTLEQDARCVLTYRAKGDPTSARKLLSSKKYRQQILTRKETLPTSLLSVFAIVCFVWDEVLVYSSVSLNLVM